MALNPPFVVRVEKKPGSSFGAIMNEIRTWLDHRKIEPISFEPVANAHRGVGFEIAFESEDEAYFSKRPFAPERSDPSSERTTRSATLDANNY